MSLLDSTPELITGVAFALLLVPGLVLTLRHWSVSRQSLGPALLTGAAVAFASLFVQLYASELSEQDQREADEAARQLQVALSRDLTGFDFTEVPEVLERERTPLQLSGKRLRNATLTALHMERLNFRDADLSNARLDGARLQEADLVNAKLTGADLTGADLTRAKLEHAQLNGTLTNATFTEATVDEQTCWPQPQDGKGVTPEAFERHERFDVKAQEQDVWGVRQLVYGHYCRTSTLIVGELDGSTVTTRDNYCVRADECFEAAPEPTPIPTPEPEPFPPVEEPVDPQATPTPVSALTTSP